MIGSLIPLYWLIFKQDQPDKMAWACFLIVVTFITVRFNFVIPDLAVYKLEGLENAFFHQRLRTDYLPNLMEWLVSIWVVSLGVLAFLLGAQWLPVISTLKGGEEHA